MDYNVQERITLNWSATSALVWTHGKKTLQQVDCQHPVYAHYDDVLTAIMTRARNKYGLYVSVAKEVFEQKYALTGCACL